jgi:hypothetical protein
MKPNPKILGAWKIVRKLWNGSLRAEVAAWARRPPNALWLK